MAIDERIVGMSTAAPGALSTLDLALAQFDAAAEYLQLDPGHGRSCATLSAS